MCIMYGRASRGRTMWPGQIDYRMMNFHGNYQPRFEGNYNRPNSRYPEGGWCNPEWDQQNFRTNQVTPEKQFNRRTKFFENNGCNYNSNSWIGFQNEEYFYNQTNFHNRNQSQKMYGRNYWSPYGTNNVQINPYYSPNRTYCRERERGNEKFDAKNYRPSGTPTKSDSESKKVSVNSSDCDRPKRFDKRKSGEEMLKNTVKYVEEIKIKDKDESKQISPNCKNINSDSMLYDQVNLENEQKKTGNGKTCSSDTYRRKRLDSKDREKENSDYYKSRSPYENGGSKYKYNSDLHRKKRFRPRKYSRSRSRSRSDSSGRRSRSRSRDRIRRSLLSSRSRSRDRSRHAYRRDQRYRSGDNYTSNRSDSNDDTKYSDNQSRQKNNKNRHFSERMKERRNLQREIQNENVEKLKQSSTSMTDRPKKRTMLLSERFSNLIDQNPSIQKTEKEKTESFQGENVSVEGNECKEMVKTPFRKGSVDVAKSMNVPASKKLKTDGTNNLHKVGSDFRDAASSSNSVGNKTCSNNSSTNLSNTSGRRRSTEGMSRKNSSQIQNNSQNEKMSEKQNCQNKLQQEKILNKDIKLQKDSKIHCKNFTETSSEETIEKDKKLHEGKNSQCENHSVTHESCDKTQFTYQPVDNKTPRSGTKVSVTSDKIIYNKHVDASEKDVSDTHITASNKIISDAQVIITSGKNVNDTHVNTLDKGTGVAQVGTSDEDVGNIQDNTSDKELISTHVNMSDKDIKHTGVSTSDIDVSNTQINMSNKDIDHTRIDISNKDVSDTRFIVRQDKDVGDTRVIITSDKNVSGSSTDLDLALEDLVEVYSPTSESDLDHSTEAVQQEKQPNDSKINKSSALHQQKGNRHCPINKQKEFLEPTERSLKIRTLSEDSLNECMKNLNTRRTLSDELFVVDNCLEDDMTDSGNENAQSEKGLVLVNVNQTDGQNDRNMKSVLQSQFDSVSQEVASSSKESSTCKDVTKTCEVNNTSKTTQLDTCQFLQQPCQSLQQPQQSCQPIQQSCQPEQRSCLLVQQSCQPEQQSCQLEQQSCQSEQQSSQLVQQSCQPVQQSCQSEQQSCQPEQQSCQFEQQSCQSEQQSCQLVQQSCQSVQLHSYAEGAGRKLFDNYEEKHTAVSDKSECLTDKNDVTADIMEINVCDNSSEMTLNESDTLPPKQSDLSSNNSNIVLSNTTEDLSSDKFDSMPVKKNYIVPPQNIDPVSPNKSDIEKSDKSENSQIVNIKQTADNISNVNFSVDALMSSNFKSDTQISDNREKKKTKTIALDMEKKIENSKTVLESSKTKQFSKTKPDEISHNQNLGHSREIESLSDVVLEQPKIKFEKSRHLNKKTGTEDKNHKTKHNKKFRPLNQKAENSEKDNKTKHDGKTKHFTKKTGTVVKDHKTKHCEKSEHLNKKDRKMEKEHRTGHGEKSENLNTKDGITEKEHKANHSEKCEKSNDNSSTMKQKGFFKLDQVNDQHSEKVKRSLKLNRPQKITGVVEQKKETVTAKEPMKNEYHSESKKGLVDTFATNGDILEKKPQKGNEQRHALNVETTETVESEVDETLPKLVCSSRKTARAHLKKLKTTNSVGTSSMIKANVEKDDSLSRKKTMNASKKLQTKKPLKERLKGCYSILFKPDTACKISKKGKIIQDWDTSIYNKPDSKAESDKSNSVNIPHLGDGVLEKDTDCMSSSEMSDSGNNSLTSSPNKCRSIPEEKRSRHLSEKDNGKRMTKLVSISPSGKPFEIINEKENTSRSHDRNIFDNFGGIKRKCYDAETSTDLKKKQKISSSKNNSPSTSKGSKSMTKKVDSKQKSYKKMSKYLSNADYFRLKKGISNTTSKTDSKTKPLTNNDDMKNSGKNENNHSKNGKLDDSLNSKEVDTCDIAMMKASEGHRNNDDKSEIGKESVPSGSVVSEDSNTSNSCIFTHSASELDKSHKMSCKDDLLRLTRSNSVEKNEKTVEIESGKNSILETTEEASESKNECNTEKTRDIVLNNGDTITNCAEEEPVGVIKRIMSNIGGKIELFNTSGKSTIFHSSNRNSSSRRNGSCDEKSTNPDIMHDSKSIHESEEGNSLPTMNSECESLPVSLQEKSCSISETDCSVSSEQSINPVCVRSDSPAGKDKERLLGSKKLLECNSTNEMGNSEQSKNLDLDLSEHSKSSEAAEATRNFEKKVSEEIETNEVIENEQEAISSLEICEQDEDSQKERCRAVGGSSVMDLFGHVSDDGDSQMSSCTDALLDDKTERTEFGFNENDQDSRSSFSSDILKTKLLASGKPLYEDITDVDTDEDSSNLVIDFDRASHSSPVKTPTKSFLAVSSNKISQNTTGVDSAVVNDGSKIMPENVQDNAVSSNKESADISEKGDDSLNKTVTLDVTDNSLSDRTIAYGKSSSEDDDNDCSDIEKSNLELKHTSSEKNKLTGEGTLTKDDTLKWLSETSTKVQESVCEKSVDNDSISDDDLDDPEEDCNIIGCFVRGIPQSPWTPMPATPATPYKPDLEEEDQNAEFPVPQLPATQQRNEHTYRVESETVPALNKSKPPLENGTLDTTRNPLSPDSSLQLTITDVRSLQDSMESLEKQFQNSEEILKEMGCKVNSPCQVQNASDCDNTDLEKADAQSTLNIRTKSAAELSSQEKYIKLNRSLSECHSENRIAHQSNEMKESGGNDIAAQSINKRSISCDSNIVSSGNKSGALEKINSTDKKLDKLKFAPKSRGNNQQNKTEVSTSFLKFLSNLRRENLEKYSAIHFTHIKTLENGDTRNTVGILEPSKMRHNKLLCVKCMYCQKYFSPHTFLLHIDTTTDKVAQESLQAEPWPTSKLSPENEVIWKKFLYIKDYRLQLATGSTSPSTNLTSTQGQAVSGSVSSSTQSITSQITTKAVSQSDSLTIQHTAGVSNNVEDAQSSGNLIGIKSTDPPQDKPQDVVKETSGLLERTQGNQSALEDLPDTNVVLQTKTTQGYSPSDSGLISPDTQSRESEGNLVVPVQQHTKQLVTILLPEQTKETHTLNPKPATQQQTIQQLTSTDTSAKQTVSKTVVAEHTVATSLTTQQTLPSNTIAKFKTSPASRPLLSTSSQYSEKSRIAIQPKTDSEKMKIVNDKDNSQKSKKRQILCRQTNPVSRPQTSVTNAQMTINNNQWFDRSMGVQPAVAVQSVGLVMNSSVAPNPQQQQHSVKPSQTGRAPYQQGVNTLQNTPPVYLFSNNLAFQQPSLMLTNNTGSVAQNSVVVSSPFEEEDSFSSTTAQYRTVNTMVPPSTPQDSCPPLIPGNQGTMTAQFQNNNLNTYRNPSGQCINSNQNSLQLNALRDSMYVNNSSSGQQNSAITTSLVQQQSSVQPFNMNPLQTQEQFYHHQSNMNNRTIQTMSQREPGKNVYFNSDQPEVMNQSSTVRQQNSKTEAYLQILTQLKKATQTTQSTASSDQTNTIQTFNQNFQGSVQPYNSQNIVSATQSIPNLNYQLPKQNIHQAQPPFKPCDSPNVDIKTHTLPNMNHQLSNQNVQRSLPSCNTLDSPNVDIRTQILPTIHTQLSNQKIQRSVSTCNNRDSPNVDIRIQTLPNLDQQNSCKMSSRPPPPYKPTVSQQLELRMSATGYQQSSQTVQENKQYKPYDSSSIEYETPFTSTFNRQTSHESVQESTPPYQPVSTNIISSNRSDENNQSQFYSSLSPQQQKSQSRQSSDDMSPDNCINLCVRDATSVPDDIQAVRDLEMKVSPERKISPTVENNSCSSFSTFRQQQRTGETENLSSNIHEHNNSKGTCCEMEDLTGNTKECRILEETQSGTRVLPGNPEEAKHQEKRQGKTTDISVNTQELENLRETHSETEYISQEPENSKENEKKKIVEKVTEEKDPEDSGQTTGDNLLAKDGASPEQSTSGSDIASLIKGPKDCLKVFSVAQNVMFQCLTWMSTELQEKSDEIERLKQENEKHKSVMNEALGRIELVERTMKKKMMDVVDMFKK